MNRQQGKLEGLLRDLELLGPTQNFNPDDIRDGCKDCSDLKPIQTAQFEVNPLISPAFFHCSRIYNSCWGGEMAVLPDGKVIPCVFARNLEAGNLQKQAIGEVIRGLEKTYWNITLDKVEKCRECEFRFACIDCRALSFNSGKGLYGAPERCSYDPHS